MSIKGIFLFLLMSLSGLNLMAQDKPDSVAMLDIGFTLDGYRPKEATYRWLIRHSCLRVQVDTVYVPPSKDLYIQQEINKLIAQNKKLKKDKEFLAKQRAYLGLLYESYRPLGEIEDYEYAKVIQYEVASEKTTFFDAALSRSECFNSDVSRLLEFQENGDMVIFKNVIIRIYDKTYHDVKGLKIKIAGNK